MRKLLIGLGVVVAILVVVIVVLPFVIPVGWVKQQAVERVEAATGRKLTIAGDVSLSILPRVQLEVRDVSFANPKGSKVANMVTLSSLGLVVDPFALLGGNLVIDRFVLTDPVIYLETDAKGRGNWQFQTPATATTGGTTATTGGTTAATGSTGGGAASGGGISGLKLGDVRIENGRVTYHDGVTGRTMELDKINVALTLPSLAGPFNGKGSFVYKNRKVSFSADAASPKALMDGGATAAKVKLDSDPVQASFDGKVAAGGNLNGQVELKIPSLPTLVAWLAKPLDPGTPAPKQIALSGKLDMADNKMSFTGAEISADDLKARGDVSVDMSRAKPMIVANLDANKLDLTPYLPQSKTAAGTSTTTGGTTTGGGSGTTTGAGQAQGWSDAPIDFSGLDAANADLTFAAAGLKVRDIEIGRSKLHIVVKNGSATLDLLKAAIYDGNGTAHVGIDRSASRPVIDAKLDVSKVHAGPLLAAATGFDRLSGTGDIALDAKTNGTSQLQFVQNLRGKGSFKLLNGAFKGVNLAAMARNLSPAALKDAISPNQKTDFAELSGTFTIANGVVKNDDLFLTAPLVRVTGSGNVNMPPRTLDYVLRPKAVASLQGQGGSASASGIGIPISVRGPWDHPSIGPDVDAIAKEALKNPDAVKQQLKSLGIDSGNLLKGLGGSSSGGSSSGGSSGGNGGGALNTLKNLFQ